MEKHPKCYYIFACDSTGVVARTHLGASSVVVQTGEAGEVLLGDGGSRLCCNQTVGVGWVSYNQNLRHTNKYILDITTMKEHQILQA